MCVLKLSAWPNDILHSEQVWVFTPLWVSMCVFRCEARPNDLWHWTQACAVSLLWVNLWTFRCSARSNDLLHSEHKWVWYYLVWFIFVHLRSGGWFGAQNSGADRNWGFFLATYLVSEMFYNFPFNIFHWLSLVSYIFYSIKQVKVWSVQCRGYCIICITCTT